MYNKIQNYKNRYFFKQKLKHDHRQSVDIRSIYHEHVHKKENEKYPRILRTNYLIYANANFVFIEFFYDPCSAISSRNANDSYTFSFSIAFTRPI